MFPGTQEEHPTATEKQTQKYFLNTLNQFVKLQLGEIITFLKTEYLILNKRQHILHLIN